MIGDNIHFNLSYAIILIAHDAFHFQILKSHSYFLIFLLKNSQ